MPEQYWLRRSLFGKLEVTRWKGWVAFLLLLVVGITLEILTEYRQRLSLLSRDGAEGAVILTVAWWIAGKVERY